MQFVANVVVNKGRAHAGKRGGWEGYVIDSGAPGGTVEGRAVWSVAGCYGHVVVDQGGSEGTGIVFF